MTSRERILSRVKQHQTGVKVEPTEVTPTANCDAVQQFKETLISIGGQVLDINDESEIFPALLKVFPSFENLNTAIPSLGNAFEADPHSFASLQVAVIRGEFGVAENGAVWLTDKGMGDRVVPFICENLVLILPASAIVPTMHHAYDRIDRADYHFGTFIAGPSKTADIEQSLVLGAHGAKTMTVLIIK